MLQFLGLVWLYQHSRVARFLINGSAIFTAVLLAFIVVGSLLRGR